MYQIKRNPLMKKIYYVLVLLGLMNIVPSECLAQGSTSGKVYLGYAKYDDYIYEYDGIYLDHTATVGCAIRLTKDMLAPYVGGTITGMRVGWGTSQRTGTYQGFVRSTFNGEDLTTGKATVSYSYSSSTPGWNNMTLRSYDIPEDVEQLIVGFTTKINKNEYAIPTLYPHGTPNSCYLWVEGDNDSEGNPRWVDMRNLGILPIQLVVRDSKGSFNFIPVVTLLTYNGVASTGEANDCLLRIKNLGSQAIKNIEVTSRQGDQSWSKTITANIGVGSTSSSFLAPLYCFHTGEVELSITKVNSKDVENPETYKLDLIGIPPSVDEQFIRRPLVEYYESENNYRSARYFDEIVKPSIEDKLDDITFVCQHLDDQFMTGDDDATMLSLALCDNDSMQISIPSMTIDRAMATDNISFQIVSTTNPMFSVLYEPYASQAFNASMTHPTFVELEAEGKLFENLQVNVQGRMAEGILPEGEKPRLTVYLMERNVDSDSQMFWTEKEKEQHTGHYTHANVIRQVLTDIMGDEIEADGENFSWTTEGIELDSEWKLSDLYLVAFVHRDGKLGGKYMYVFNSCEGGITDATGIEGIKNEELRMKNEAFDLAGRRVTKPNKGLYIMNGKKMVRK